MTFGESIVTCLRKYADFTGRASRSEYWWFFTFLMGVFLVTGSIAWGLEALGFGWVGLLLLTVSVAALALPSWAVGVRRCHDTGHRLLFTPMWVIHFWKGEPWPNKHGPPPGLESVIPVESTHPSTQAGFLPCPGCRKPLNAEIARCPYCGVLLGLALDAPPATTEQGCTQQAAPQGGNTARDQG